MVKHFFEKSYQIEFLLILALDTILNAPRYKKSSRFRELQKSIGAAYRIRTYDVLIRSQTLYPAEVTPQRTDYYARDPSMGQATIWKNFTKR